MDKHLEEFLEKIYDEGYGYIANNYNRFSKEELKDIILETLYALTDGLDVASRVKVLISVKEELQGKWEPVEEGK